MEFEIRFFPQIIEVFFTEHPKEIERQVKSRLKNYFEIRENTLELAESKIGLLDEIFRGLKKLWKKEEIPLPFSLVPRGKKGLFRPGRIYLSPKEAPKIKTFLEKSGLTWGLIPWEDFLELVLPETFREESSFPYRDLLLLGPFRPCPLCGLRWHSPSKCPSLREKEAFTSTLSFLKKPPATVLKEIARNIENGKFKEVLKRLAPRVFYLKPAFLELLFSSGARTWESLPLKSSLSQGGNLFLGLEALRHGQFRKARERFLACDLNHDWRANLSLTLLNAIEERTDEAFYYVEKALHLAEAPLHQAYLIFWKAWLLERERKFLEAEELYQEALKKDRAFWPARHHLAGCQVKYLFKKARNTIFSLQKEPLAFPSLLFEGRFLPFAPELEKGVKDFFEEKQKEAIAKLAQAENSLRPLMESLPEEEIQDLQETLVELRKSIYEGGFLELLGAEKKVFELTLELQGYLFRQNRKLRQKFKTFQRELEKFENFWRRYPYRNADDPFQQKLQEFRTELGKLGNLLKQDPKKGLKPAFKQVKRLEEFVEILAKEEARLRKEWHFRKQLSAFVKIFLILEVVLFLVFLVTPGLYRLLEASHPPPIFRLSTFIGLSVLFLIVALLHSLRQKIEN